MSIASEVAGPQQSLPLGVDGSVREGWMTAGRRMAVWVVIALLLTLAVIQYSLRDGRLSAAPAWDDVMYMRYGVARVNDLYSHGAMACVKAYFKETPHSPFSCFLAFASYAVFGLHDWAPYLSNFCVLAMFFALVDWLLGGVRFHVKLLTVLYLSTIPVVIFAVTDFKPHIPWGMAVAAGTLMAVLGPFTRASRWHWVRLGILWAAALLIKTSTVPATVALLGLSLFLATVRDWVETGVRPRAASVVWSWGTVLLVAGLIAGPHYVVHRNYIAYYIWHAMYGEYSSMWTMPGGWETQARYFLDGEGGRINLSGHLYILPVIWLVGMVLARRRRDSAVLLSGVAALVFIAACYTVCAVNPAKNALLGAHFFCTLVPASAYWIGYVARGEQQRFGTTWRSSAALCGLIVAGVFLFHWPSRSYEPGSPVQAQDIRLHREVYDAIRREAKPYTQQVTVMAFGPVRQITLDYYATLDRLPFAFDRPLSAKAPDYVTYCDRADLVLAQEDQVMGDSPGTPNWKVQGQVLRDIRGRDDFAQVGEFTANDGKKLFLFRRTRWTRGVTRQVRATDGFGVAQGPNPRKGLPLFRWGTGERSRLVVLPEHEGKAVLRMECRAGKGVTGMRVLVDGAVLATHQFGGPGVSERVEVPMVARNGQEITIEYESPKGLSDGENAVLFTLIEVATGDQRVEPR